jgi:hypothetical protein
MSRPVCGFCLDHAPVQQALVGFIPARLSVWSLAELSAHGPLPFHVSFRAEVSSQQGTPHWERAYAGGAGDDATTSTSAVPGESGKICHL